MTLLLPPQTRKEVTVLKDMTKGEWFVAEMLGEIPNKGEPILTEKHPFFKGIKAYGKQVAMGRNGRACFRDLCFVPTVEQNYISAPLKV